MKLKNCVIGQRVKVKDEDTTGFFSWYRGKEGVITEVDDSSHIRVKFDHDDTTDWGRYTGLSKVKGA